MFLRNGHQPADPLEAAAGWLWRGTGLPGASAAMTLSPFASSVTLGRKCFEALRCTKNSSLLGAAFSTASAESSQQQEAFLRWQSISTTTSPSLGGMMAVRLQGCSS